MGTRRIDSVRIATSQGIVEVPWESSQELRGRLLAADLDSLEDEVAVKGTSASIVIDLADKEPLLELVLAWIEDVGEKQAVALGAYSLSGTRFGLTSPPRRDPPVGGERASS